MLRDQRRTLTRLLSTVRYEAIPTAGAEDLVREFVPPDVTITVTASPVKGLEPTLDLTVRLAAAGHRVVPHLAARSVGSEAHLKEIVERLLRVGVEDVFIPAGDADPPAGPYDSALPVLAVLTDLGRPFARVGITGYPESHPSIEDDITVQSMWDKRHHATYIVSNLCFDARVLTAWVARVRRRRVALPVFLGLAGPVDRARLLTIATRIGVKESARFMTRHGSWFTRLAVPGAYSPDVLLRRVVRGLRGPDVGVTGLHVFTFNHIAETERWRQQCLSRFGHDNSSNR